MNGMGAPCAGRTPAPEDLPARGSPPAVRHIIVTGGARGLGWEMAEALVEAGHRVVITGAREAEELQDAAARLNAAEPRAGQPEGRADPHADALPRAIAVRADVASWDDCQTVARRCLETFGRIDGLINNAGRGMLEISPDFNRTPALFWQADPAGFQHIIDANVTGAFLMARACVPAMVAQGFGRVLNISTSAVTMVRTGYCPYGPSKAALEAMSAIWAKDLHGTGVTVNVLLPGGASDTRLLPGQGAGRTGADGLLLPPALMRRPARWLMTEAGEDVNGERYVARLWREDLPPATAASLARSERHELPAVM